MSNNYNASTAISTVFARELRENLLKRSTLITLAMMVIITVGGIIATDYFTSKSETETTKIAVVGEAPFANALSDTTKQLKDASDAEGSPFAGADISPLEITAAKDEAAARHAVTEGGVDAALVPAKEEGSWRLLDDDAPSWLAPMLQESLQKQTEARVLGESGINPQEFYAQSEAATISVESITGMEDEKMPAIVITLVGVMIMITAILVFGAAVATSVIEEKSSRVIEIILSTVRPLHLLTGKILGAATAGLIMMGVIVASSAIALAATGLSDNFDIPWSTIWLLIPCFILGYFFFATLYAASASLVSRMEDFQGAQMPVMLLSLISMYVPLFGWAKLDSTFMEVAAWIPPISITTAPMQYAAGNFSGLQLFGALAVMALGVAAVIWLAAWIYPRNVLRTGAAISWKSALTAKN